MYGFLQDEKVLTRETGQKALHLKLSSKVPAEGNRIVFGN